MSLCGLGLLLGTEAPVMTPNGIDSSFLSLCGAPFLAKSQPSLPLTGTPVLEMSCNTTSVFCPHCLPHPVLELLSHVCTETQADKAV